VIEESPSVAEADINSTKTEAHERKSVLKKFIQMLYDCLQSRSIEKRRDKAEGGRDTISDRLSEHHKEFFNLDSDLFKREVS